MIQNERPYLIGLLIGVSLLSAAFITVLSFPRPLEDIHLVASNMTYPYS
jgi:hypothetical protein